MKSKGKDRYSYPDVLRRLKKWKYDKEKAPEDIKLLVEVAECFLPVASTAAAATAATVGAPAVAGAITVGSVIAAISKKGKILSAAKRVMELLKKDIPSFEGKYERMEEAYTILWIASFFDAFARTVPKEIIDEIALTANEKEAIAASVFLPAKLESDNPDSEVKIPNLVFGVNRVDECLKNIYGEMKNRLGTFITKLEFSDKAGEKKQRTLDAKLEELPSAALDVFKDQYLTLCSKFPDFVAYINLEKEREYTFEVDEQNKALVDLIIRSKEEASQGFQALEIAMQSFHKMQRESEAQEVTNHIKEKYKKAVKRPIVDTEDTEELIYPPITEAFVPQQYKLLEYTSQDMRLELESQWVNYESREDMLAFWAKYLLDLQSTSYLVLILGDPGGGKSLLTEMVSAQISSDAELVVKIPLRQYVNMISDASNTEIEDMICLQLKEDGDSGKRIETLKEIVGDAPNRPTTLIFDGYDEVQQATGLAYPTFLKKLKKFQEHCSEENRPVRIVVTSRRTLIDKAIIPIGTVVMKLLAFEPKQKAQWIETWNHYNHEPLSKAGLVDFGLPENNRDIDELSSQPLLLLMLAMYDADFETGQNALQTAVEAQEEGFNRMRLYDELIRRFIRRELLKGRKGKGPSFADNPDKQAEMVNDEMEKLGIAALGMFVRRRLWITVPELNTDFSKLMAKKDSFENEDTLEAGEIFLGSFFFIHDSRSKEKADSEAADKQKKREKDASFVFLHKTFYEFLTVDYVLNGVFQYAIKLSKLKKSDEDIFEENLEFFEKMPLQFYMSLNSAPLCAELEITAMISEWGFQKAVALLEKQNGITVEDLLEVINDLIIKHTECIRKGIMNTPKDRSLLQSQSVPQRNALYILNLVTVRTLLNGVWETGLDMWRFLAQYVKLYAPAIEEEAASASSQKKGLDASEELPLRFVAIFQIEKSEDGRIAIKKRDRLMDLANRSPVDARTEVFCFLQDRVSEKVYSLHSVQKSFDEKLKGIKALAKFDRTLCLEQETARLQATLLQKVTPNTRMLQKYIKSFRDLLEKGRQDAASALTWLTCFRQLVENTHAKLFWDREDTTILHVTEELFRRSSSSEWEAVLLLWLELLRNELPYENNKEWYGFFRYLLENFPVTSDNAKAFYIITQLSSQAFLRAYRYSFEFHEVYEKRRFRDYLMSRLSFHSAVEAGPKGVAIILMLARFMNSEEADRMLERFHFDIGIYKYYIDDERWWEELPCLLREYVAFGKKEIVQEVLNSVHLTLNRLCSPAILEYIAIADVVDSIRFLEDVFHFALKELQKQSICCFAFTRAAYVLLSRKKGPFVKYLVVEFISHYSLYRMVLEVDPVGTIRLLTSLLRIDFDQFFANRDKDECIMFTFEYIKTAFMKSPQTAIAFLQQFKHELRGADSYEKVDLVIRNLILQAQMNGQMEEAEQLKGIL